MDEQKIDEKHIFDEKVIEPPKRGAWKIMLPVLALLVIVGLLAYYYHWEIGRAHV